MSTLLICVVLILWPLAAEGLQWSLQEPREVFLWEAKTRRELGRTRLIWMGSSDIFSLFLSSFGKNHIWWTIFHILVCLVIYLFLRLNPGMSLMLAFGKLPIISREWGTNLSASFFFNPVECSQVMLACHPALHVCSCSCSCFTRASESPWISKPGEDTRQC